jgi:hypothetical protein
MFLDMHGDRDGRHFCSEWRLTAFVLLRGGKQRRNFRLRASSDRLRKLRSAALVGKVDL